ncbi:hypothetical protein MNBD_GAMMA13-802 [hydrothermal vent metagenome]|uniref:Lysophospholipid acyltransferase n=1 Tax=hydrothermal vent metagenome TaxID=652676 RepID=A0A3B0YNJ6_9ZZZZ
MSQWLSEKERGALWTIRFMSRLCSRRYRWLAELLLYPVVGYFFLTAGRRLQASRHFFERASGHFSAIDHYRQLMCFARSLLDRIAILSGGAAHFQINSNGREQLVEAQRRGKGVILLGSHLGNFEASKALIKDRADINVHVVAYFGGSQKIRNVLDELQPELATQVIDPTEADAVFHMRDVIEAGGILAILGDRTGFGERTLQVDFLGEPAQLPAGPYFLAAALHCPVYCFFGMRVGTGRYDTYMVKLADRIRLTRGQRAEQAQVYAQRFADLLADKARNYPYNWFNFYEFWNAPDS